MNAEPYDIARMASLLIRLLMDRGTSTDDAIRALQLAERMLRDAGSDEQDAMPDSGYHLAAAD